MKKLIVCVCLALVATLGCATLKAQYGPLTGDEGGSTVNWKYDSATRTLTLSGRGRIPDYAYARPAPWATQRAEIAAIVIESGVTGIGEYAFAGCTALTSVQIPASVTEIEDFAFSNCTSLPSITIPVGVTEIEEGAFSGCSSLRTVTLPVGVQKIGNGAFADCASLPSITLPTGLREIEKGGFSGCTALTSVSFPTTGLTDIGEGAFYSCTNLSSVTIPVGVREIGRNVFYSCTTLASVSLPASLTKIGEGAFAVCNRLRSVTVAWPEPLTVPQNIFQTVPVANAQLIVPRGTEALYRTAPVWSAFRQISSVANAELEDRRVYAADGILYLSLPRPELVRIYDVSGRLLRTFSASAGSSTVPLAPGYQFVQVGEEAEKVYVD